MKIYRKITAAAFILFLIASTVLFSLTPVRDYSETEKRNLAKMPAFSLTTIADGSFMDGIEDYVSDQFPFRDGLMNLKTAVLRLSGSRESQGVYLMKDGSLAERFDGADPENYRETVDSLNTFKARFPDTPMYFLLAPNAVSVYADRLPKNAPTDSQKDFIKSFFNELSPDFSCIDIYEPFRALRYTTKLYYGSDHHWTTAGAYEAYQYAAKVMALDSTRNVTPAVAANDFIGSLASKSGFGVKIPDSVEVYTADEADDFYYTVTYVSEGARTASCYDTSKLETDDPYQVFFGGNHSLVRIETSVDTDRSLLVIKDSYANAFVPFLIRNYKTITVLDPRYYYDDIDALMGSGFSEVLFLYNVNTFSEDTNLKTVLRNEQ